MYFPQLISKLSAFPIKIPAGFFVVKIDKLIYNFYGKAKGPDDLENKENSWRTIALRMVWGGHKVRQTDLWNRDSRNRSRSPNAVKKGSSCVLHLKVNRNWGKRKWGSM